MRLLDPLWNLIFPIECLGCRLEDYWLCPSCLKKLRYKEIYFDKNTALEYLDGVFVILEYCELVSRLIKTLKYRGAYEITPIICLILKEFLEKNEIKLKSEGIISVPLSPFRERWRGFNQSELIARELANITGKNVLLGLKRVKNRPPQAGLSRYDRLRNMKGCFAWKGQRLKGKNLILIDDVMTTGSTLNECARALKTAGARKVVGLVLARPSASLRTNGM